MNGLRDRESRLPVLISAGCLVLAFTACATAARPAAEPTPTRTPLDKQQALDIAWQALEPNTSSHDLSNWEIVDVKDVTGSDVLDEFNNEPAPGCLGPTPPPNATIAPGGSFWYVEMRPRRVTPVPLPTEMYSPTAPPGIPEPFTREARFLIDLAGGQVVARKLSCVIY